MPGHNYGCLEVQDEQIRDLHAGPSIEHLLLPRKGESSGQNGPLCWSNRPLLMFRIPWICCFAEYRQNSDFKQILINVKHVKRIYQ